MQHLGGDVAAVGGAGIAKADDLHAIGVTKDGEAAPVDDDIVAGGCHELRRG